MPKLTDPNTGRTVFASAKGAVLLRRRGYTDTGMPASPQTADPPPKFGTGSGRDAWAAYAETLGIDTEGLGRNDIITQVEERE